MEIDFSTINPSERYFAMVQSIIPRPIAWVLTVNENKSYNLAPYSFFTGICSDPALVIISAGKKINEINKGDLKDTRLNILERKKFVIHIAGTRHLDVLNHSAKELSYGESEVEWLDLNTTSFADFELPRLSDCDIALGCSLYRIDEVGNNAQAVIYGEIEKFYVNDELASVNDRGRLVIEAAKVDPLARLGGSDYSGLGKPLRAERPK